MHWRKIIAVAVALIGEILFGASLSSSNVFADSAPATAIPAVSCEGSGTTITITIPPPNSNGKLDSTYVAKIVELAGLAPPSCQVEVLKGGLKAVQDAIRTLLGGTLTMKNTAGTPKAESNHVAASSPTAKPSEPDAGSQAASSSSSDGDLAQYRDMLAHLQLEINNRDLNALHLDVFTATSFSNLYRDPAKDSSYFSKSKSFLFVEISQTIFSNLNLDTYGLLKFQSSSTVSADQAKDVLAATSGFGAEWGLIKWLNKKGRSDREFDFGIIAGGGAEAFVPVDSAGAAVPNKADQFHPVYRAGLVIKQNAGAWEGSYSEFSFLHDPRFVDERRLLARVRAVVSPPLASGGGKGLGAYVEGSLNAGRGRDEARVTVGIRVDALGVLRALVGAGNVGSPSTPAGDPSSKTSSK